MRGKPRDEIKHPGGRPRKGKPKLKDSDLSMEEQITLLASQSLPGETIAVLLGITRDTLYKNSKFSTAFKKGQQECNASLYRVQWESAVKHKNATMMIWLGKQRLGQKDKFEDRGTGQRTLSELVKEMRKEYERRNRK